MTPYLQVIEWPGEITVLAKTEMIAIGTYETCSDYGFHIATHTLVLVMSCQTVSQQGDLHTLELVTLT